MEKNYIEAIKKLVRQYYDRDISVGEYRARRRQLIDHMDQEFNATQPEPLKKEPQAPSL